MALHHLRTAGPCSRARIAADRGLNKATVSSLVAELVDRGLVELAGAERGAVGRPGQLVRLDGNLVCGIGGGMVSSGRILRGGHGFGGEVGHMAVGSPDLVCGCGRRGCWESSVQRLEELALRTGAGDPRTLDAIDEVRRWLAIGASVLVNVLNPDVLVPRPPSTRCSPTRRSSECSQRVPRTPRPRRPVISPPLEDSNEHRRRHRTAPRGDHQPEKPPPRPPHTLPHRQETPA